MNAGVLHACRSSKRLKRPPLKSFIAHGKPPAADALRQRMEREFGWVCQVPEYLETVELA